MMATFSGIWIHSLTKQKKEKINVLKVGPLKKLSGSAHVYQLILKVTNLHAPLEVAWIQHVHMYHDRELIIIV